jgi:hypothetical protein
MKVRMQFRRAALLHFVELLALNQWLGSGQFVHRRGKTS